MFAILLCLLSIAPAVVAGCSVRSPLWYVELTPRRVILCVWRAEQTPPNPGRSRSAGGGSKTGFHPALCARASFCFHTLCFHLANGYHHRWCLAQSVPKWADSRFRWQSERRRRQRRTVVADTRNNIIRDHPTRTPATACCPLTVIPIAKSSGL